MGGGGADFEKALGGTRVEQIRQLRSEVEKLNATVNDKGIGSRFGDAAEYWLGIESGRTKALEKIAEDEKKITIRQRGERLENLAEDIEKERIASLAGVEKLEAQRSAAIHAARAKYGNDADALIAGINKKYDAEEKRFEELEAKKKKAEDDRERERQDRYLREWNDIIQTINLHQLEAGQKTAESIQKIMGDAAKNIASQFSFERLQMTLDAIEANSAKIARQRMAAS